MPIWHLKMVGNRKGFPSEFDIPNWNIKFAAYSNGPKGFQGVQLGASQLTLAVRV
jgi:hypothetical protein